MSVIDFIVNSNSRIHTQPQVRFITADNSVAFSRKHKGKLAKEESQNIIIDTQIDIRNDDFIIDFDTQFYIETSSKMDLSSTESIISVLTKYSPALRTTRNELSEALTETLGFYTTEDRVKKLMQAIDPGVVFDDDSGLLCYEGDALPNSLFESVVYLIGNEQLNPGHSSEAINNANNIYALRENLRSQIVINAIKFLVDA